MNTPKNENELEQNADPVAVTAPRLELQQASGAVDGAARIEEELEPVEATQE